MNFWSHRDIFGRWRGSQMCFRSHRDISRWFRRAWMCFRSHRDISRWSRRRGQLARSQCCIDPHYCQLRKFHEFVRFTNFFIYLILTTARISSSNFRIVSSFSCSRSFCCRNRVIMADGWSCSSRVSKISSTDEIIFLVDTLWPIRTFRFLASFPDMKIDTINPSKIQIKTSRNSRLSHSIQF